MRTKFGSPGYIYKYLMGLPSSRLITKHDKEFKKGLRKFCNGKNKLTDYQYRYIRDEIESALQAGIDWGQRYPNAK